LKIFYDQIEDYFNINSIIYDEVIFHQTKMTNFFYPLNTLIKKYMSLIFVYILTYLKLIKIGKGYFVVFPC